MTETSTDLVLKMSKEYALYVCEHRAIPKLADGLKDVQRKVLYLIKSKSDKIKTVSLAGSLIAENIYNHGDASASAAISMMAAPYCNNICFLEGTGAFGTRVVPTGWGAPRYTYVKKSKAADLLMYTDFNISPLQENYDGSAWEPNHFLPLIPVVLLNGISGLAVGWNTEILPRKLDDIIENCIRELEGKLQEVMPPYFTNYDVVIKQDIDNWIVEGKVEIVDTSTIKIVELPPDISVEKFKERLINLEDSGQINGFTDYSTKTINMIVKFPRGSIKDWTEEKAIDFFKLRTKLNERIVVLDYDSKRVRTFTTPELLIEDFVKWRLSWFTVRYQTQKDQLIKDLNFSRGVKKLLENKFSNKISEFDHKDQLKKEISVITDSLSEDQIEKIASWPTYKWVKSNINDVDTEIKTLETELKKVEDILQHPEKQKKIYINELKQIKKAGL